jgi:hypothetical protein
MKYNLNNSVSVAKFEFRVKQLLKEKAFVELKKINPIRSNQQNKYLHVLISYFASEYGEQIDYIKQYMFKEIVNPEIFKTEYVNKVSGEVRESWRSTAEIDSGEMTIAIERFRDFASKEAGIYLPGPKEEEFIKHCIEEVSKNRYV